MERDSAQLPCSVVERQVMLASERVGVHTARPIASDYPGSPDVIAVRTHPSRTGRMTRRGGKAGADPNAMVHENIKCLIETHFYPRCSQKLRPHRSCRHFNMRTNCRTSVRLVGSLPSGKDRHEADRSCATYTAISVQTWQTLIRNGIIWLASAGGEECQVGLWRYLLGNLKRICAVSHNVRRLHYPAITVPENVNDFYNKICQ
jgi:hypothetical protein